MVGACFLPGGSALGSSKERAELAARLLARLSVSLLGMKLHETFKPLLSMLSHL